MTTVSAPTVDSPVMNASHQDLSACVCLNTAPSASWFTHAVCLPLFHFPLLPGNMYECEMPDTVDRLLTGGC